MNEKSGEGLMTFANDLSVAIRKSSKELKKGSKEDSILFLQRAGILTSSGQLKARFKVINQKSAKTVKKSKG